MTEFNSKLRHWVHRVFVWAIVPFCVFFGALFGGVFCVQAVFGLYASSCGQPGFQYDTGAAGVVLTVFPIGALLGGISGYLGVSARSTSEGLYLRALFISLIGFPTSLLMTGGEGTCTVRPMVIPLAWSGILCCYCLLRLVIPVASTQQSDRDHGNGDA